MALEEKQTEPGRDPGGGLWERLDASRHEVVKLCGEKGIALFSFLLTSSTIDPDQENIAIFSLQRLHDVAVQLGWSPDTVKRYVAVFRAINLVSHHHDQRREVQLRLPLGPYTPLTTFSALDELISKRKKQRQLALKVKARYIVRFGDPTLAHSDELRQTLQEVKAILEDERLEPLKRERLQMKIADVLTRLAGIERREGDLNPLLGDLAAAPERGRAGMSFAEGDSNQSIEAFSLGSTRGTPGEEPDQEGDSNRLQGDSSAQHHILSQPANTQAGDPNRRQGDSNIPASLKQTREMQQTGDSDQLQGDLTLSVPGQQGHQAQATQHHQGDLNQQQGDLMVQGNPQPSQKTTQLGDSKPQVVLKEGDSKPQAVVEVHANAPYTYNVNYLISNITGNNVIRKRLAQFLASVLEKNEYENGYPTFSKYLKAFKCYSPEVIGRAFLATMVLLHRKHWRVEKPGATFTDQCRILSGQMSLAHYTLDDVEEWLRAWGNLPYPELIVAIAAPAPAHPSSEPAPLVTTPRQGIPTQPAQDHKKGLPGHFGANTANNNRKKRTYGMHYTGLPSGRKGFNTAGANRPPQSAEKS